MHDLSVHVGRKYYDGADDEFQADDVLRDPLKICFGKIAQSTLDEYNMLHGSLHERYPVILDPLARSIQLSLSKYNKNRDPAS